MIICADDGVDEAASATKSVVNAVSFVTISDPLSKVGKYSMSVRPLISGRLHGLVHELCGPVKQAAAVPPPDEDQRGEAADRRHRAAQPVRRGFVKRRRERGEPQFLVLGN